MRIAICDDEKEIIEDLRQILIKLAAKYNEKLDIDGFCQSKELVMEIGNGEKYDMLFLDIQMPGESGIDLGKYIRNTLEDNLTQIVYISGESKYAMELFRIRPMDFIIKPLDVGQIENVFLIGRKLVFNNQNVFQYKVRDEVHRMQYADILYFYSEARKIVVVTTNSKIEYYEKMENLYEKVKKFNFLFIHKSYIINNAHIVQFKAKSVLMDNGDELPISRSKRDEIKALWIQEI